MKALTGLNQQAKDLYRDTNVFEDADIQMAGYAAALRVLTRYAVIDGRDMTGFVDGTANPPSHRAADVALVPPGEPGEGGSHVLVMRWVHDLEAFNQLAVEEQQHVIGRTKPDSVELAEAAKPPTAHIARVTIEVGGEELKIFRRSVPYGTVREHGLYFVAFSADQIPLRPYARTYVRNHR